MWNGIDPPFKDKPEAEESNKACAKHKKTSYVCLHCLHRWGSNQPPVKSGKKMCPKCKQEAHREPSAPRNPQPEKKVPTQPEPAKQQPKSNKENRNPGRQKPLELPGGADNRDKRPKRGELQQRSRSAKNPQKESQRPQKSTPDPSEKKTPYQGEKRCFGEYHCVPCNKRWESGNSWANIAQQCKRCGSNIFPHRQKRLEPPSIGDFRCPRCKKSWTSDRCWDKVPEPCPGCKTKVCPHDLLAYADPNRGPRSVKPHPKELCQKCQQLGYYCGELDSDEKTDQGTPSRRQPRHGRR